MFTVNTKRWEMAKRALFFILNDKILFVNGHTGYEGKGVGTLVCAEILLLIRRNLQKEGEMYVLVGVKSGA